MPQHPGTNDSGHDEFDDLVADITDKLQAGEQVDIVRLSRRQPW